MEPNEIKKATRENVKDIFGKPITDIIDKALEREDNHPDEYLISTHFAFRQEFKRIKGTARRIEGFSELWYFLFIKKFLEKNLKTNHKIEFKPIESHERDLVHYHFEAEYGGNTLILSSDLSPGTNFDLKIHPTRKIRPDIFIGIRREDNKVIPIAIFEIKLHQNSPKSIGRIVSRFEQIRDTLLADNTEEPFFIFLYLQHSQYKFKLNKEKLAKFDVQLERFKKILKKKSRLVINRIMKWKGEDPEENTIEGSIYQIMTEICSFIKQLSPL